MHGIIGGSSLGTPGLTFNWTNYILEFIPLLVILAIFYVVAARRPASSALRGRSWRIRSFVSPMPINAAHDAIIQFAHHTGYRVEEEVSGPERVVLSDSPSWLSWGYFYPVYLARQGTTGTLVEIDIKSRLITYSWIIDRRYARFFNRVQTALGAVPDHPEEGIGAPARA